MNAYIRRAKPVEVYTFEEFIVYGKNTDSHIVNGVPWAFTFKGHVTTHLRDDLYLINNPNGDTINFTPNDILVRENDLMKVYSLSDFHITFKKISIL